MWRPGKSTLGIFEVLRIVYHSQNPLNAIDAAGRERANQALGECHRSGLDCVFHDRHRDTARGVCVQCQWLPIGHRGIGTGLRCTRLVGCCGFITFGSETDSARLGAMNEYWVLAFVITPALVVILGWAAVFLHEYQSRRRRRLHPGE